MNARVPYIRRVSKMNALLWLVSGIALLQSNGVLCAYKVGLDDGMILEYAWKTVRYDYPDPEAEVNALQSGEYIPRNIVPLAFDYHPPTDRYFLSLPLLRAGNPTSLGVLRRGQNKVTPFPKLLDSSERNMCQKDYPLGVFRMHIDKCGFMWVPDTGIKSLMESKGLDCPAKLLVYDLNNMKDELIFTYEFPSDVVNSRSLLSNIITECYKGDCSDTFAYITDDWDYGLVVFDFAQKTSWRVKHKYFYIFPTAPTVMANGLVFDFRDGLCGIALSPATDKRRKLYFHSLSSLHESWAPVSVLKNSTAAADPAVLRSTFSLSPGTRSGASILEVMTDDGILIYSVISDNTLYCWNIRTPYVKENLHVVKRDDVNFDFISGLKLINNKLYITSSRLQNYWYDIQNITDVNYRLLIVDVKSFLQSTPCGSAAPNRAKDNSRYDGSYLEPNSHKSRSSWSWGSEREYWSPQTREQQPRMLQYPEAMSRPRSWTSSYKKTANGYEWFQNGPADMAGR